MSVDFYAVLLGDEMFSTNAKIPDMPVFFAMSFLLMAHQCKYQNSSKLNCC